MDRETLQRLDYLESRMQILDCINRIARGVDRLDREIFRSGFHDDAVLDFGSHIGSPDGHMDFFFDLHRRRQTTHAHTICNHTCEIDGDTAHSETYYIFGAHNVEGPPNTLSGGRYIDRFENRGGRWAIALRKCAPGWNLTSDNLISLELRDAFALVGHTGRDRDDISYQRPSRLSPERLATARKNG